MSIPAIYVSFNQLKKSELSQAVAIPIDGAWLVQANSPDMCQSDWRSIVKKRTVIEQGCLDANWMFNPDWPNPAPVITQELNLYGKNPNYIMVYHEDAAQPFPWAKPTFSPDDLARCYGFLKRPLIVLYRWFEIGALNATQSIPYVFGGAYEFNPDIHSIPGGHIPQWIDAVIANKKVPFLLIPPSANTVSYETDVIACLNYIKKRTTNFAKTRIVLAVYGRDSTGVDFFGTKNTVEAAVKKIKQEFT